MKKLLKYFVAVSCGIVLISCYGLEKEEYRELAPITVSGLEQTIYAKATEKLTLNSLRVESGNRYFASCFMMLSINSYLPGLSNRLSLH